MDPCTSIPQNGNRHCSQCLKPISGEKVKLCGGCHRRAYCSRDCQITDWSPSKHGQGHKNWCKLECGEEDLEWKVAEVQGKGLGLIALRDIPAKYRIIVEAGSSKNHPAFNELLPVNGSAREKFDLNCLGSGDFGGSLLCLRMSRANHECDPNAGHFFDKTHRVKILFAEKDIRIGEEICIRYQTYGDVSTNQSARNARLILQSKWGIVCKNNCFCQNAPMEKIIEKGRDLDRQILKFGSIHDSVRALMAVRQLLEIHNSIHSSWISKMRTHYDGFQVAIMQKKTLEEADEFIRKAYEIQSAITSPNSSDSVKFNMYMQDPSTHSNYLIGEG